MGAIVEELDRPTFPLLYNTLHDALRVRLESAGVTIRKLIRWRTEPRRARRRVPAGVGRWGMYEFVEPQVRRLVADQLGVGREELGARVSLRADLAADSLDLVELALALEGEFAIMVPERILDEVHTYSDLVHATGRLIHARCAAEARGAELPQRIWARIEAPAGESHGTLERTGWLTPYTAETIAEDAVGAGRGARLDLTIAANTAESLVRAQRQFAGLGKRGILVTVQGGDGPAPPPLHSSADRVAEPRQGTVAGADPVSIDSLLDQLTGTHTIVTAIG